MYENVVNLMDEGNTIPFIARYRKEMHGAMDDTTLREPGRPAALPAQSSDERRRRGEKRPSRVRAS